MAYITHGNLALKDEGFVYTRRKLARSTRTDFTYADYLRIPENVRSEVHDGVIKLMATPSVTHQMVAMSLCAQLYNFLRGKPCKVIPTPVTVRLHPDPKDGDKVVFEPDVIVVCDEAKLQEDKACKGAPDFVAEILSPSTRTTDQVYKLKKYQEAGVREYWIIDPTSKMIEALVLDAGRYIHNAYDKESGEAPVTILPGCVINTKELFAR
jgi:Uma2 family endonuclease